ncbi:hypothetical protein VIBHAR_05154 [Vibrio campbellii ATCC BAA-1116]|uniref:Uncharacterized protein n=1 Tax=Vibrio campbellii (strain ATCC BAA-1116) TaxID=2902295 RepID=A7N2I0_VIBC1|nr:hypothetical protein VIBHAR_05154 [Vibrio campbellii ATCC BAA-1116]
MNRPFNSKSGKDGSRREKSNKQSIQNKFEYGMIF